MKKLHGVLAVVLGLAALTAQARDWKDIRLATEGAYSPFNEIGPDGKPRGFDVDIGNAICVQMKARCTWIVQDWDGMIPALLANKFDAIAASMTITPERQQKIAFTEKYYSSWVQLIARTGAPYDAAHPATLKGVRIGVQRETTHEKFAREVLAASGAEIVSYPSLEEAYMDLKNSRLDATLQDTIPGLEGFIRKPDGKGFALVGEQLNDPRYFGAGQGIGLRKEDDDLRQAMNRALKEVIDNGQYETLRKKYFDVPIL
ncbi:ABC transporter substrate-binding protein [Pseudomonas gingeri NCPPB 3146 = LMG 5327]|uniref:ABC transporter substrate-binding protein n=2 Tax=Pseudomonas gingeri TaxID=117681 RepID=A0A7Y8CB15_9PSED|nr:ABC transporter substrate-binding protein [Pseudomonas gingeri]NWA08762.1 ABC transporter substrate-binding protein [Pseudomonas gingeri]NWC12730.1 ABC transporter substrate-binding protein [Pseudomonas gingeri]NWE49493.1 ABC transporter substrate-binding protein [Pseudomonas gingeri]NWE70349.1 ABC transporter substrate-binding protein [Pseudomonas gingeri]PNQ93008.1 ABC transporter substrate-binding protein [Pseudomonas gingeri NCPPB 3146 = LMG 5327]